MATVASLRGDDETNKALAASLKKVHVTEKDHRLFAVKKMKSKKAFEQERAMLNRLSGIIHKHIITLLMSFSQERTYYFLFPLAECDLDRYFRGVAREPPIKDASAIDAGMMRWFSSQVLGIMEATSFLHNARLLPPGSQPADIKYGRHGDIKPQNILWFPTPDDSNNPRGILVITDLGCGKFNSTQSRSNIPNKGIQHTPDYRPPECDLEGGTISRLWDVWTLGCLFLEMVCWLLGGQAARDAFEAERSTNFIYAGDVATFLDIELVDDTYTATSDKEFPTEYIFMVKEAVTKVGQNLLSPFLPPSLKETMGRLTRYTSSPGNNKVSKRFAHISVLH